MNNWEALAEKHASFKTSVKNRCDVYELKQMGLNVLKRSFRKQHSSTIIALEFKFEFYLRTDQLENNPPNSSRY